MPASFPSELSRTVRLAAPLVGGQLAMMGMNFIDTVMAGNLNATALASVALGSSVWSTMNLLAIGILMALQPSVAEMDGAGRRDGIAPLARQAFWVAVGLAVVMIVLLVNMTPLLEFIGVEPSIIPTTQGYLSALVWGKPAWMLYLVLRFTSEGVGDTRPSLYFGLLGLPINAVANYILIYGKLGFPELGAVGCGYATSIVRFAELGGMLIFVATSPTFRGLGIFSKLDRPDPGALVRFLRVGVPIGIALGIEASLFSIVALFIGSLGTIAVAAHQVALNFVAITFMIPLGISMAVTVRVGNALGRRDAAGIRLAALAGLALVMVSQVVSATVMLVFPRAVASIYTHEVAVISTAVELLFLGAIFQLSDGLQVSAAGALRGIKDTRAMMIITVFAYWLCGLPLGYYLGFVRELGPRGMWMGLIAGLTLAAVLLSWRFWRVAPTQAELSFAAETEAVPQ